MSRNHIHEKLEALLSDNMPFRQEAHLVYLLVEARKLLDREKDNDFPLLRFYCDWSVHTAKDRITPAIKSIMEDVFANRNPTEMDGKLVHWNFALLDFSQMEQVKTEVHRFLEKYNLPISLTEGENWVEFVTLLVNILADQPIINPCKGIKSFSFKPSEFGKIIGQIVYEKGSFEPEVQNFTSVYISA